jgi:hypothetical protein
METVTFIVKYSSSGELFLFSVCTFWTDSSDKRSTYHILKYQFFSFQFVHIDKGANLFLLLKNMPVSALTAAFSFLSGRHFLCVGYTGNKYKIAS